MAVKEDRDDLLPVQKVGEIMPSKEPLWLIEHLWQMSAAGIIGGNLNAANRGLVWKWL